MKCCFCKNNIPAGAAAQKMIVEYQQADGTTRIFGYMMPDGPLTAATGRILRGYHGKCFWVVRKREARGDAVTGRVLIGAPTAYEIAALADGDGSTEFITERLHKLREVARRIGKGVGDATVLEAFWADEHGGPYEHTHHLPLEAYQLRAHLGYAHGLGPQRVNISQDLIHDNCHARMAQARIDATRTDDPDYAPVPERDWRSQVVGDVENLT